MRVMVYTIKVMIVFLISTYNQLQSQTAEKNRYELAYNTITEKTKDTKPFWEEFQCDASGTKIIPKTYQYKGIYENYIFDNESKESKNLKILSKKYSKSNWRKDKKYKILKPNEVKDFHGPLNYIYFTEIKNDTLKAQIISNPFGKYEMTTCENYLLVFENKKIKSLKKWLGYYE